MKSDSMRKQISVHLLNKSEQLAFVVLRIHSRFQPNGSRTCYLLQIEYFFIRDQSSLKFELEYLLLLYSVLGSTKVMEMVALPPWIPHSASLHVLFLQDVQVLQAQLLDLFIIISLKNN